MGGFDGIFILKPLIAMGKTNFNISGRRGDIFAIEIDGLVFRDFWKLLPASLDEFTKSFLNTAKMDVDYRSITNCVK
jgi:hypothetical protein